MLEYSAVEPRKSVKRTICEPTVTSLPVKPTSRANKFAEFLPFVTRAAVRMSSSQLDSCNASCTGQAFGLRAKTFFAAALRRDDAQFQFFRHADDFSVEAGQCAFHRPNRSRLPDLRRNSVGTNV